MRTLNESQENELKISKYLISGSASSREGDFFAFKFYLFGTVTEETILYQDHSPLTKQLRCIQANVKRCGMVKKKWSGFIFSTE